MSPNSIMRPILIMAGGTGGHVYPALAVAHYLRDKGATVCWLGTQRGLEASTIPKYGIELLTINLTGIRGKSFLSKLSAPLLILRALFQSVSIILKIRPALVLGMGGYVSGPGGVAAWLCRVPLCIHEQNAIVGLTNRLLAPLARVVMQAFPQSFSDSEKVTTCGNPLRASITEIPSGNDTHEEVQILVVGGSLGAFCLNTAVPEALALIPREHKIKVKHQTGAKHFNKTIENYSQQGIEAEIMPFIDDMAAAYYWADIVICRAGAMTVAEISAVGVAAILIPFPYAVDDHQTANARYLSEQGYAVLMQEKNLTVEKLSIQLTELILNSSRRESMAEGVRSCARLSATRDVAEICWEIAYAQ